MNADSTSLSWKEWGEGWWRAPLDSRRAYHVTLIGRAWSAMRIETRDPDGTEHLGYRDTRAKAIALCEQDAARQMEVAA